MDPVLQKQVNRFKKNKRGLYSLVIITILFFLSLFSELIANNQPIVLKYQGNWYFPVLKFYPASIFGQQDVAQPDYKALAGSEGFKNSNSFVLFPPIPFGSNESVLELPSPPPSRPTFHNWLGTDDRGRDLLTRLIYGFRNSMLFALVSWLVSCILAYGIGSIQGYLGGKVDLIGQRGVEIWRTLPILFVIIYLRSVFPATLGLLLVIWIAFHWIALSTYVRAEVLRVRKMDYITAAVAVGAQTPRILFKHILRNSLTSIITLSPFMITASIGSLAALDYLGLGLTPPAASWGELLRQGKENLDSWWLAFFPFLALFSTLLLLNFVGEAFRSAFDVRDAH